MPSAQRVGGMLRDTLRELERRWIRPLGRRLRPTRAQAAQKRRATPEAEELIVALIRDRLRQGDGCRTAEPLAGMRAGGSDLNALVHTLLATPPRPGLAGERGEAA